jgi:hypothetical protein
LGSGLRVKIGARTVPIMLLPAGPAIDFGPAA